MNEPIPVVLFAYTRLEILAQTVASLRVNEVPLIIAFADGAKSEADAGRVAEARALIRRIDWCEVRLVERPQNMGLGKNILAGVSEVATQHEAFIVWEDDLIAAPGTYVWVCAALRHYAADRRVMSISAWTHPRVTPDDVGHQPYFDGRAECWVWGAWARSWQGMVGENALAKLAAAERRGVAADAYGADLEGMARIEEARNIWAVRWLYHHLQHGGLCVRPPWSMVDHIGFDALATNAGAATAWSNSPLRSAPAIPSAWPEPCEHPHVATLWRAANSPGRLRGWWRRLRAALNRG